jgi:hypothetical protein
LDDDKKTLVLEGDCFIREGTRTSPLDDDGKFALMRDLVWRYGRR